MFYARPIVFSSRQINLVIYPLNFILKMINNIWDITVLNLDY
jgi:hypothetical protein